MCYNKRYDITFNFKYQTDVCVFTDKTQALIFVWFVLKLRKVVWCNRLVLFGARSVAVRFLAWYIMPKRKSDCGREYRKARQS